MSDDKPQADNDMTVSAAREQLQRCGDEGSDCPVCGTFIRVYRRKISSSMARFLIAVVRAGIRGTFSLPETRDAIGYTGGKEESRLTCWGLLTRHGDKRVDGAPAHRYSLTERGIAFARGELDVRRTVLIPGNNSNLVLDVDGPMVTITDCLGERFDYDELMYGNGEELGDDSD